MRKIVICVLLMFLFLFTYDRIQAEWYTYNSKEGKFSIKMPGEPTTDVRKVNSQIGTLDMNLVIFEKSDAAYLVAYTDYPSSTINQMNIDEFLNNARDGAIANVQGKLLSEQLIKIGTYPGRQIKAEFGDGKGILIVKFYLVGYRLYTIMVTMTSEKLYDKEHAEFFISFKLEKGAGLPLIDQLLKDMEYNYEIDEDGQYYFTLKFEDERNQTVYISPVKINIYEYQIYDMWSPVASFNGELTSKQANALLEKNGLVEIGAFQVLKYETNNILVYSVKIPGELDITILQKYILSIASTADESEKDIFNVDNY